MKLNKKKIGKGKKNRVKVVHVVEVNGKYMDEMEAELHEDDPQRCNYIECNEEGAEENSKEDQEGDHGENGENSEVQDEDNEGQDEDDEGQGRQLPQTGQPY